MSLVLGLLISLSVIFAAGIAVYENPQVRQWVDSSRRKIAIALHSLGDEINPRSNSRESPDASTHEDESPEAVERRRKARQEIMERARAAQERRKSRKEDNEKSKTFDELVDENGVLRTEKEEAITTATEDKAEPEQDLRKRNVEITAASLGSATANPFADELHADFKPQQENEQPTPYSRSSTPTISTPPEGQNTAPSPPSQLLVNTDEISNHPSEDLVDLTPTTSTSSGAHADLAELWAHSPLDAPPGQQRWSVHEWAENAAPSFYSPPQSDATGLEDDGNRTGFNTPATGDHLSRVGSEANLDIWSDAGDRISTPGSWTEVGSVVSEDY